MVMDAQGDFALQPQLIDNPPKSPIGCNTIGPLFYIGRYPCHKVAFRIAWVFVGLAQLSSCPNSCLGMGFVD
jgi:hypothetical protein